MNYTTGTYLIRTVKLWQCTGCQKNILMGIKCFVRIKEYGQILTNQEGEKYKQKNCIRYHIECAKQLDILSNYEQQLLNDFKLNKISDKTNSYQNSNETQEYKYFSSEHHLRMMINKTLRKYEDNSQLMFLSTSAGLFKDIYSTKVYQIGRKGFSDFIVFLPNKVFFIELKCLKNRYLNNNQKIFKEKIEKLGYSYYIISTPEELISTINNIS